RRGRVRSAQPAALGRTNANGPEVRAGNLGAVDQHSRQINPPVHVAGLVADRNVHFERVSDTPGKRQLLRYAIHSTRIRFQTKDWRDIAVPAHIKLHELIWTRWVADIQGLPWTKKQAFKIEVESSQPQGNWQRSVESGDNLIGRVSRGKRYGKWLALV